MEKQAQRRSCWGRAKRRAETEESNDSSDFSVCFQPFLLNLREKKSGAGRRKEEEWSSVEVNQECASILRELRARSRFIAKIEKLIWPKG